MNSAIYSQLRMYLANIIWSFVRQCLLMANKAGSWFSRYTKFSALYWLGPEVRNYSLQLKMWLRTKRASFSVIWDPKKRNKILNIGRRTYLYKTFFYSFSILNWFQTWTGQDASVTFWSRFSEAYFSVPVGDTSFCS